MPMKHRIILLPSPLYARRSDSAFRSRKEKKKEKKRKKKETLAEEQLERGAFLSRRIFWNLSAGSRGIALSHARHMISGEAGSIQRERANRGQH